MQVSWYTAMSMDGRIAGPSHDLAFLSHIESGPAEAGDFESFMATVDGILIGANTIRWLFREGHGLPAQGVPVWLLTHDAALFESARQRSEGGSQVHHVHGDIGRVLDAIAAQDVKRLWLCGGGDVAGQALRADRVTDVIVTIAPTVIGSGPALFDVDDAPLRNFTLDECRRYGNAARLRWLRDRPRETA